MCWYVHEHISTQLEIRGGDRLTKGGVIEKSRRGVKGCAGSERISKAS